jgi:hypothetical protein
VLQINNRQGNMLELKINSFSNVEKVKVEAQKPDFSSIGILNSKLAEKKPKMETHPE